MSEPVPSISIDPNPQCEVAIQPAQPYKPCCNPCPCTTLQCGAKIIAIVEIILSMLGIISGILVLAFHTRINAIYSNMRQASSYITPGDIDVTIVAFAIVDVIVALVFAVFLLLGTNELSRSKCWVWFIGTWIVLFIAMILAIRNAVAEADLVIIICTILLLLLIVVVFAYFLSVVYAFMQELKYNCRLLPPDEQGGVIRPLLFETDAVAEPRVVQKSVIYPPRTIQSRISG